MRYVVLFLLLAIRAQASDEIVIRSSALGEERHIEVQVPARYAAAGEQYPVVYVLDGDNLFAPVAAMGRWLEYVTRTPGLIVVGIRNTKRTRDFTSGADAFLSFVETELQPEIQKRYRAAPFRILIGHSLGGRLALEAFAKRPDLFQGIVAISSPGPWSGARIPAARQTVLFLAAAGNDPAETTPTFHRIVERLRDDSKNLRWSSEIFSKEDHGTVALPAAQAGLQFIFSRWRIPGYVSDEGLKAIGDYYAVLSSEYGYSIRFQEAEMARLGYQWLRAKRFEDAVALFTAIARDHPDSANAQDDLRIAREQAANRQ